MMHSTVSLKCSQLFHFKLNTLQSNMSKNGVINLHFLTLLTQTLEDTIVFCKNIGLLPNEVKCPICKKSINKAIFCEKK